MGFSPRWLLLRSTGPGLVASVAEALGLSCLVARGIFLDQGLNLSPALQGEFLSPGPPGKSSCDCFSTVPGNRIRVLEHIEKIVLKKDCTHLQSHIFAITEFFFKKFLLI